MCCSMLLIPMRECVLSNFKLWQNSDSPHSNLFLFRLLAVDLHISEKQPKAAFLHEGFLYENDFFLMEADKTETENLDIFSFNEQ